MQRYEEGFSQRVRAAAWAISFELVRPLLSAGGGVLALGDGSGALVRFWRELSRRLCVRLAGTEDSLLPEEEVFFPLCHGRQLCP